MFVTFVVVDDPDSQVPSAPEGGVRLECAEEPVRPLDMLDLAVSRIRDRVVSGAAPEDRKYMIQTPKGNWINKATAVVMLRELWVNRGSKSLSADRLKRIEQSASTARSYFTQVEEHGGE